MKIFYRAAAFLVDATGDAAEFKNVRALISRGGAGFA
jgi:hypothetical protein